MIAKNTKGTGLAGALGYIMDTRAKPGEGRAEVVAENIGLDWKNPDLGQAVAAFKPYLDACRAAGKDPGKHVRHFILSEKGKPAALDAAKWGDIAPEHLEAMGFEGQPFVAMRHNSPGDTCDHIHIITTALRLDGTRISDSKDYERAMESARAIERRHGLEVVNETPGAKRAATFKRLDIQPLDPSAELPKEEAQALAAHDNGPALLKFARLTGMRGLAEQTPQAEAFRNALTFATARDGGGVFCRFRGNASATIDPQAGRIDLRGDAVKVASVADFFRSHTTPRSATMTTKATAAPTPAAPSVSHSAPSTPAPVASGGKTAYTPEQRAARAAYRPGKKPEAEPRDERAPGLATTERQTVYLTPHTEDLDAKIAALVVKRDEAKIAGRISEWLDIEVKIAALKKQKKKREDDARRGGGTEKETADFRKRQIADRRQLENEQAKRWKKGEREAAILRAQQEAESARQRGDIEAMRAAQAKIADLGQDDDEGDAPPAPRARTAAPSPYAPKKPRPPGFR